MRIRIRFIIGLALLTIGLLVFYHRVSKIKAGIVTNATVLHVDRKQSGKQILYKPVLRFINYRNEAVICTAAYEVTDYYTGEKVKILYTKDHYDTISILSYWGTFGLAVTFFCGALISMLITGGEYLAGRFFATLKRPIA